MKHSKTSTGDFERVLILSDLHGPFLDSRCWKIVLNVIGDWKPDTIILNGDVADFSQISRHDRKIRFKGGEYDVPWDLYEEIMFIRHQILDPLRKAAGKAKIIFRKGNHEQRWDDIAASNPGALEEMLVTARRLQSFELPDILQFKKFVITYDPKPIMLLHDLFTVIHGVKTSKMAPRDNLRLFGSGTSGHTHRLGVWTDVMHGKLQGWFESGCLRNIDDVEYLPFGSAPDWGNGFLTLYINKKRFFCNTHMIIGRQCVFNGKTYTA